MRSKMLYGFAFFAIILALGTGCNELATRQSVQMPPPVQGRRSGLSLYPLSSPQLVAPLQNQAYAPTNRVPGYVYEPEIYEPEIYEPEILGDVYTEGGLVAAVPAPVAAVPAPAAIMSARSYVFAGPAYTIAGQGYTRDDQIYNPYSENVYRTNRMTSRSVPAAPVVSYNPAMVTNTSPLPVGLANASPGGFRLVPALDIPPGNHPNDAGPSQWFEILRPGNEAIRIGRVSSSCVCVSVRVSKRHIAAGERALIEARTITRPPYNNLTYGMYVGVLEPVNMILDVDVTISL